METLPRGPEAAGTQNSRHAVVLLLVDDQAIVAEAIRRMLADEGDIEFHYCKDPTRAVETAKEVKPTIILQDIVMPEVDGYTLLRRYRADPSTASTPVIVLSTKEDPRDKSMAFEKGASDYLVKLPDRIELVARIRAHSGSYLLQMQRDEAYRELKKLQEQLEERNAILQRLSVIDGLTGIANRRHFDEILRQEWKRGHREAWNLAVVMIDIDFFKKYNDNYGHQGGDDCLKKVASTLSNTLHRPGDFIARYGGEEFVVLLPNTDAEGAAIIAEHMRSNIEAQDISHALSGVAKHVTISLGVASVAPDDGTAPEDLIARADEALYKAKAAGRNRYVIHGQ
ncbi:MAG: PleD family two-component system response regulator [Deltaproteobacteria bacterium]|nr:PleD family two-component system response regulator [Deltaproteobacteria bacterium]